jgi:hypothetical protein
MAAASDSLSEASMKDECTDRHRAIQMRLAGQSVDQICQALQRSRQWVHSWWGRYLAYGPDGLFDLTHANPAQPRYNGIAERFVLTLKQWLETQTWNSPDELAAWLTEFIAYYNDRPHQGQNSMACRPTNMRPAARLVQVVRVQDISARKRVSAPLFLWGIRNQTLSDRLLADQTGSVKADLADRQRQARFPTAGLSRYPDRAFCGRSLAWVEGGRWSYERLLAVIAVAMTYSMMMSGRIRLTASTRVASLLRRLK